MTIAKGFLSSLADSKSRPLESESVKRRDRNTLAQTVFERFG